jgi:inhibitor of cysteine peptidase
MARIVIVIAIVAVLAAGTVWFIMQSRQPAALTEADAGSTVQLQVGDSLAVRLEGNPSTGYIWEVAPQSLTVLEQVGDAEFDASGDQPGAPGTLTLRFKAVSAGEQPLRLVYRRPWEADIAPADTYEVTVVVR